MVIVNLIIYLLFGLTIFLFFDKHRFLARFMKNPTRLWICHANGRITKILTDLKKGEKSYTHPNWGMRLLEPAFAYKNRLDRISEYFYTSESSEPIDLSEFRARITPEEMQQLAFLFELAGSNEFIPSFIKQVKKTVAPYFLILALTVVVLIIVVLLVLGKVTGLQELVSASKSLVG